MLKSVRRKRLSAKGFRIAVVASEYNAKYVDGMLAAARGYLEECGAEVEVVRVPGAFEIPVAVAHCVRRPAAARPDGVICLGLIWQGQTDHAHHIGEAVTSALMSLQVGSGIPCIHEVLAVKTEEQARARCLDARTNKGLEAAMTAVRMARVIRSLGRA